MAYFQDIRDGISTTLTGLGLTLRHLRQAVRRREVIGVENNGYFDQQNGLVTVQYPHETLPIPDNGRYRLHNEIDDCIVCDKCAKICPVDCITIDPIKATEEVGRASDGSPIRLYAATFDIDMAKCCYCGLCTVVCPTECLTMEKKYDYSTYELADLNYAFANLTPEQADEKRALYEQYIREKEAAKVAAKPVVPTDNVPAADAPTPKPRPAFRPGMKPAAQPVTPGSSRAESSSADVSAPEGSVANVDSARLEPGVTSAPKPRPVFRLGMKPKPAPSPDATPAEAEAIAMEGVAEQPGVTESIEPPASTAPPKPKPAFRPSMKPKAETTDVPEQAKPTPDVPEPSEETLSAPKPKPAFRPTMKPKS